MDHDRERRTAAQVEQTAEVQRFTEARRRFQPIIEGLRRNRDSLDELSRRAVSGTLPQDAVLHPQLLGGAWSATCCVLRS